MVPKVFVKVTDEKQVSSLLRLADRLEVQVTFRAAGTSLLGQAITNSVLFLLAGGWTSSKVQSNGDQIVLEPGAVGFRVNDMLNPLGRKIDPDPASIHFRLLEALQPTMLVECAVELT
jgi:D-lactate dehydrogenase